MMREHHYELNPVLERMFLSKAFYSKKSVGSQIKSPVQFMVQLTEDVQVASPPFTRMAQMCARLGQDLFYPPNVKGWDGGKAWINANSLLSRYNMPQEFAYAASSSGGARDGILKSETGEAAGKKTEDNRFQFSMAGKTPSERKAIRVRLRAGWLGNCV